MNTSILNVSYISKSVYALIPLGISSVFEQINDDCETRPDWESDLVYMRNRFAQYHNTIRFGSGVMRKHIY
jgi:hypothetical protein